MASKTIPGVGIVNFPDSMDEASIDAAIKELGRGNAPADPSMMTGRQFLSDTAVKAALPTIGQVAGGTVGALAGPGPMVAGEMLGGAGGEAINQLLGITRPSPAQIGVAAASGPVGRLTGGLFTAMLKRMPGAAGALQTIGIDLARTAPTKLPIPQPSAAIYDQIKDVGAVIDVSGVETTVNRLLGQLPPTRANQDAGLRSLLEGLQETIAQLPDKKMAFQDLRAELRGIGEKINDARRAGGPSLGAYRELFKAGHQALDAAAASGTTPAAELLRLGNLARKREFAAADLTDMVENSIKTQQGSGQSYIQGSQLRDALAKRFRTDELFSQAFTDAEKGDVLALASKLGGIPRLPPPGWTPRGAGIPVGMFALGHGAGLDPQMASMVAAAPIVVGMALMTPVGRMALRGLLSRGPLDHEGLALLAQIGRSGMLPNGPALAQPMSVGQAAQEAARGGTP